MIQDSEEKSRAQFEAQVMHDNAHKGYESLRELRETVLAQDADGSYSDMYLQMRWDYWGKARRALLMSHGVLVNPGGGGIAAPLGVGGSAGQVSEVGAHG